MTLVVLQVVLTIGVAGVGAWMLGLREDPRRQVARALVSAASVHAVETLALVFAFGDYTLYSRHLAGHFLVRYVLLYLVLFVVCFSFIAALTGRLAMEREASSWTPWDVLVFVFGALFLGLAGVFFFVPRWFSDYFGVLTGDQLVFLLTQGTQGETTEDVAHQILHFMVIPGVLSFVAGASIVLWRSVVVVRRTQGEWRLSARLVRRVAVALSAALMVGSVAYAFKVLPLTEIINAQASSDYIEKNYVEPTPENITFPTKKRNLIHIYLESMENSYYDKAEGGYMEENLMPDLARLTKENVSFSNRADGAFGGPEQTSGAVHSIAAIINMWAGIPMKTNERGRSGAVMDYPNFTTTGDILAAQGYRTEFLMGTDAAWGGLGGYFEDHGDFKVFAHEYAMEHGYIPEGYKVWWGFEDDKLYEYGKQELTALAETGDPFYFVMQTVDTHFPGGYVSPLMTDRPFDAQYANVIHYSQAETVKFIEWVRQQPFFADTTIIFTGDHRSMDKDFFEDWDTSYDRTVVNGILNGVPGDPGPERTQNRKYAPFDLFPTSLAAIGAHIEGERLGLGTNLYSNLPTLVEMDGLDKVNTELSRYSQYYMDHEPSGFTAGRD